MAASVQLYTQHMTEVSQLRSTLTAMKALMDGATFRTNLIALNSVEANISDLPFPTNLIGRISALSAAIKALETTLAALEDGIRGVVLYPEQG